MLHDGESRPFGPTSPDWLWKGANSISQLARCCPQVYNAVCERQCYWARRKHCTIGEDTAGNPAAWAHHLMLVAPHHLRHHGPTELTCGDVGCEFGEFLLHVVHDRRNSRHARAG